MAHIIKMKNELLIKRNKARMGYFLTFVVSIALGLLCVYSLYLKLPFTAPFILALPFIVLIPASRALKRKADILSAGISGERTAVKALGKAIPVGYTCITNAHITYGGKQSEIDMIVVGESGVFVIEVKSQKGLVLGSYDDRRLRQIKRLEEKELYNPVKQVSTQVDRLARYLRYRGVKVWINGIVYFNNPQTEVKISDIPREGIKIFAESQNGISQLVGYLSTEKKEKLSKASQNEIIKYILNK